MVFAALRIISKDWLGRNQDNVSEWRDMSICRLLFQWASTITIQLSVLVLYKADIIIISLTINLFSPWYSWQIAELALNNNHCTITNTISAYYWVVSSNPVHGDVYSIQHYVINFISELRQVGGFPQVLRFPPPINLTIYNWNSVESGVLHHKPKSNHIATRKHVWRG